MNQETIQKPFIRYFGSKWRISPWIISHSHKLLKDFDKEGTLFYLDPPYMHEMKDKEHKELLNFCIKSKAMILISGYDNPLYNDRLKKWRKITKQVQASGFRGSVKRTECLWINPQTQVQKSLF